MRSLILLVFCLPTAAQEAVERVQILYTGKLLGYARNPELLRLRERPRSPAEQDACRARPSTLACKTSYDLESAGSPSDAAKQLMQQINERRARDGQTTSLLLGMGDNFAMETHARVMLAEKADRSRRYLPKDELFYLDRTKGWYDLGEFGSRSEAAFEAIEEDQLGGRTMVPADNVATFFTEAGFNAMVPGKHDFYFGPERLRQYARLLASNGVTMLGANLIIRSQLAQPPPERPEYLRAQRRSAPAASPSACGNSATTAAGAQPGCPYRTEHPDLRWALPKTVLPWVDRFRLRGAFGNDGPKVTKAELCVQERADRKPASCEPLRIEQREGSTDGDAVLPDSSPVESERTYLVCATPTGSALPLCQQFFVLSPYFQFPDRADKTRFGNRPVPEIMLASGRKVRWDPREMNVEPYWHNDRVIVMGVVAPGLEKLVGALNTQWINEDADIDTGVSTIDPGEALGQLLDYCEKRRHCTPDKTYVLMAQMPRDAAQVVNQRLGNRFHAVISQADSRFATAATKVDYVAGHPPLVLVPREIFEADEPAATRLGVGIQEAMLSRRRGDREFAVTTQGSRRRPVEAPAASSGRCLDQSITTQWKNVTGRSVTAFDDSFRTLVLHAMRRQRNADVALVQERDFFELRQRLASCLDSPAQEELLQANIEHILWKGDFVMTRTLTGAAIRAALRESERLRSLEDDVYSIELEKGRGLLALGLTLESGVWYANGMPLDDKLLYAVAMTDFLAFGDTGYADLREPAVPPSERARTLRRLPRLSDLVGGLLSGEAALPSLDFSTYLDYSNHGPFLPAPAASLGEQLRNTVRDSLRKKRPGLAASNAAGVLGQDRPYWRVFLEKAEFAVSEYRHNKGTQDRLRAGFQGIPENGVLNRQRFSIANALQFEVRHELPRRHYFARVEEEFSREKTQQDGEAGAYLHNNPLNLLVLETGYRFAFRPGLRRRPWHGVVVSLNGTSQVAPPFEEARLCVNPTGLRCESDVTVRSRTARTSRLLGKAGYRFEARESWLELGILWGRVVRPTEFAVLEGNAAFGDAATNACRASSDLVANGNPRTLAACLRERFPLLSAAGDRRLAVRSESGRDNGAFFNFNIRWRLPKVTRIEQIALENRGRFFFNTRDLVFDTKLNDRFSIAPTIRILPSLSLKPTYSLFFFQNRVTNNLLFGRIFDLRIEYRFNRPSGVSWSQALKAGWAR